jgi:hypothetical protein
MNQVCKQTPEVDTVSDISLFTRLECMKKLFLKFI